MFRTWRQIARDPALLLVHLGMALVVAIVLGLVFWDLDKKLGGIQNRAGFFFMVTLYASFTSMSALSWFIAERRLRWREWAAHAYSAPAMFISVSVCDLVLLRLLPSLCLSTITYLMVGLVNDNKHFLMFLLIVLLTSSISGTICLVFSAATKDIGKANLCVVMMFAFAMMFGGLLTNSSAEGVAGDIINLQYLSFIYYAWCALMINEFKDIDVLFNPNGFEPLPLSGQIFLDTYGVDPDDMGRNIFILVAFQVVCSIVAAAVLAFRLRHE